MVWAFTELMVDRPSNTGFLDFYAAQAGASTYSEVSERMIRVLAPVGVGAAQLLSGRQVGVPTDRIVEMTEEDARPLYRGGWIRVTANSLNVKEIKMGLPTEIVMPGDGAANPTSSLVS